MTFAFWSAAALLLAGALLFVLPPLLRPPPRSHAGPSPLAVYREQRAQFDAELAQGTLTEQQHAAALAELQYRVVDEVGEVDEVGQPGPSAPGRLPSLASILAVSLLLPAGALALYGVLGQPSALMSRQPVAATGGQAPHTMSGDQMQEMVERLAERLKQTPDDADGWHMLARSYVAFGRLPEAVQAYERANTLAPKDPQVLSGYADTLAMVNGRSLEGRPMELVNAALKIDPTHQKSLALAGTAAFNRGDYGAAVALWQKLQATLAPDSEPARSISTSIAQAQAAAQGRAPASVGVATAQPAAAAPVAPAGVSDTAAATTAATAAATTASSTAGTTVEGSVTLSDTQKTRVAGGDTLFVFARAVNGPRMPLAIVRVAAGEFPYHFKLDDSLAMSPQFKLSSQTEVVLGARISRSGNATPQSGDLMGTLGPVKVGARGLRLIIDGVVP